ncbi:unnamed protein product, partial [marine sediment metagenome]
KNVYVYKIVEGEETPTRVRLECLNYLWLEKHLAQLGRDRIDFGTIDDSQMRLDLPRFITAKETEKYIIHRKVKSALQNAGKFMFASGLILLSSILVFNFLQLQYSWGILIIGIALSLLIGFKGIKKLSNLLKVSKERFLTIALIAFLSSFIFISGHVIQKVFPNNPVAGFVDKQVELIVQRYYYSTDNPASYFSKEAREYHDIAWVRFSLSDVKDGDTIADIRFGGANTPETWPAEQPGGKHAKAINRRIIKENPMCVVAYMYKVNINNAPAER